MQKKINVKILNIIILIVLVISTSIVTVCAEKIIASKSVTYSNQTSWIDYNNVHNAVDELYEYCIKNTFAKYLKSLSSSGTVITDDGTADHNMRYTGISPNNYVTFAGEEWRVIGVFNNIDNGTGKKEARVKIIKSVSIGDKTWHTSNVSVWKSASLNAELQSLSYASNSMVENAVWYLGDEGEDLPVTKSSYEYERSTNVASGNDPTWTGKVALMYPSDYGFASSGCKDGAQTLYNYNESACINSNWLYLGSSEWVLSPRSTSTSTVRRIGGGNYSYPGRITRNNASYSYAVRPTVYLKSGVECKNCSDSNAGTKSNPFQLSY